MTHGEGTLADVLTGAAQWCSLVGDVDEAIRLVAAACDLLGLRRECFDVCMTDPPYALGSEPSPKDIEQYITEGTHLGTNDFMGMDWQLPTPPTWRAIKSVCKPGAWLGAYGGTQTEDLLSVGLRMAGWERRDAETLLGTARLLWVNGMGMPKGLRVGETIDESSGHDRDIIGNAKLPCGEDRRFSTTSAFTSTDAEPVVGLTAPATTLGATWNGWGTDLAPRQEPLMLFRKPLATVTSTELRDATGWDHWFLVTTLRKPAVRERMCAKYGVVDNGHQLQERQARSLHDGVRSYTEIRERASYRVVRFAKNDGIVYRHESRVNGDWQVRGRIDDAAPYKLWSICNVAANTIVYGTGGININACRTGVTKDVPASVKPDRVETPGGQFGGGNNGFAAQTGNEDGRNPNVGRWPSNVAIVHAMGCCEVGQRTVRTGMAIEHAWPRRKHVDGAPETVLEGVHGFAVDGKETIAAWLCVAACPVCATACLAEAGGSPGACDTCGESLVWQCAVAALDEQSGELHSHGGGHRTDGDSWLFNHARTDRRPIASGDSGGASRFFPTFAAQPEPWHFAAKCHGGERDAGLTARNTGLCLKPLRFGKWAAKLLCPQGGLALVPYAGTGSEAIALLLAVDARVVMIERTAEHAEIARQRIRWWLDHPDGEGARKVKDGPLLPVTTTTSPTPAKVADAPVVAQLSLF